MAEKPGVPLSLAEAAVSGDRLATLVALRDRYCSLIESSSSAVGVAQLGQRLQEVLREIAEIQPPARQSKADELRERRRERAKRVAG